VPYLHHHAALLEDPGQAFDHGLFQLLFLLALLLLVSATPAILGLLVLLWLIPCVASAIPALVAFRLLR
jgi:hypothetical protein